MLQSLASYTATSATVRHSSSIYLVDNLSNAQTELASLASGMLDMFDLFFKECLSVRQLFSADSQALHNMIGIC